MNVLVSYKNIPKEEVFMDVQMIYEYEKNRVKWICLVYGGISHSFAKKDFSVEVV